MTEEVAATSAPETVSTPATPAPAPAASPAASTTPPPSASAKADKSNSEGRNRFDRPTPRAAVEEAVAKQRQKPGAMHYAPKPALPATPSAPAATAASTPIAKAPAAPQTPTAPPTATAAQPQQAQTPAARTIPADRPRTADGQFKKLPRGWKSSLAPAFESLPIEVQEEAHRREDAAYDGLSQYKEGAARWSEIEKTIQPYVANIRAAGATPAQAIQYLFNIDHTLRHGTAIEKQRMLATVAQQAGINLSGLADVPQESQEVAQLRQQIAQQNQALQQLQQAQGHAQLAPYNAQIEQFKSQPGHEHFAELEPAMTGLISSGAAKTLDEAYESALWARPDLREAQLATQRQQWEQEQSARVEAAKSAAVQVRGAPAAPATPQTIDPKNRRAVILENFRNLQRT